jgi:two-component system, chemotaxis family, chemotaxis protein CheY
MKLLIVDDSKVIRQRIARLTQGHPQLGNLEVVGAAGNGVLALELFRSCQPDLVTMDLTMPEMDGVRCTGEMNSLNPDVLILVISAISDKTTAIRALEQGARGFLYKPFTDEQLLSALIELVS